MTGIAAVPPQRLALGLTILRVVIGIVFWWVCTTLFGLVIWLLMLSVRKRQLRKAAAA